MWLTVGHTDFLSHTAVITEVISFCSFDFGDPAQQMMTPVSYRPIKKIPISEKYHLFFLLFLKSFISPPGNFEKQCSKQWNSPQSFIGMFGLDRKHRIIHLQKYVNISAPKQSCRKRGLLSDPMSRMIGGGLKKM